MSQIIEILSADEIRRTITRLASQVLERSDSPEDLVLLGVYTRGVTLAHLIAQQIEILETVKIPVGALDITFYRDDLAKMGTRTPAKSKIPFDLTDKEIILVDDVIFKGRTIRASLNAIADYGRPQSIRLLVLVDRGHREVPIHPDYTGKKLPTSSEEQVKVYFQETDGRQVVELIKS